MRKVQSSGDIVVQFEKHEWLLNSNTVDPAPDVTPPSFSGFSGLHGGIYLSL